MRVLAVLALGVLAVLPFTPVAAYATPIECQPQPPDPPGDCNGDMTYTFTDANNATLTFTLNNLDTFSDGGFITAFVFNNPDDLITGISEGAGFPANFNVSMDPDNINGQPFGRFDFLVALNNGSFEGGGGNPNQGIPAGGSATFVLELTGNGLDTLTDASFREEFSVNSKGGSTNIWGAVRYRGFSSGGSDKDPLAAEGDVVQVPLPMTLILLGAGLIGMSALTRRKLKK